MSNVPVDIEMAQAMDIVFNSMKETQGNPYTDDQLRCKIVCRNLYALADALLMADSNPGRIGVDLKKVVLGILGTAEWLTQGMEEH